MDFGIAVVSIPAIVFVQHFVHHFLCEIKEVQISFDSGTFIFFQINRISQYEVVSGAGIGNKFTGFLVLKFDRCVQIVVLLCAESKTGYTFGLRADDFVESIFFVPKRKTTPFGVVSMVDDIGLEPMTFRTSSGCSSQLS